MRLAVSILVLLAVAPVLAECNPTNAAPDVALAAAHSCGDGDAGWTPVLLRFGGSEVFGSPLPNVYGLGLGMFSVMADDVVGVELALGVSGAGHLYGFQAGGLGAGGMRLDGMALGGVMAGAERLEGVALAGLFAFAETGHGIVASFGVTDTGNAIALANAPRTPFTGIQLAGIANFSSDVTGVQLAIVFNLAWELHGLQIGLFNRAITGCGIQIGLLNIFGQEDDKTAIPFLNARF